jgi:hypothetical protein
MLAATAVLSACAQKAVPGSYPGSFQREDQTAFGHFNQPTENASKVEGMWSTDKSQCHKGFALDHAAGYGTYWVDTSPKGVGAFEQRIDEVHSIFLHKEWIGRYYVNGKTLILVSAAGNRMQRTAYAIASFGTDSLAYGKKAQWTYDLWEGTQLTAATSEAGSLVRCESADLTGAYLASDPELTRRIEALKQGKKALEAESAKREQEATRLDAESAKRGAEAGRVFVEQKRFDTWLEKKKSEYKAEPADGVLRQTPLLADQRYWIIGTSLPLGTVKFGALQTVYVRMRYVVSDQECLKNNVCPEYFLVMHGGEASKMLAHNSEVRGLVGKFVGVVNSAAGTPSPIFEPAELYQGP